MIRWWLSLALGCSTAPPPVSVEPVPEAPVDELAPAPQKFALSQILVSRHRHPDAEQRKEQVLEKLHSGEDFSTLAHEFSDAPSAPRGGALGVFEPGRLSENLEQAILRIEVGETTTVATEEGWQVLRRDPVQEVPLLHILVASQGAASTQVLRARPAARKRAEEALAKLQAGEAFAIVAARYSDDPSGPKGGEFGWLGPGQTHPELEKAAFLLKPGETSGIIETPYGYHILFRPKENAAPKGGGASGL